MSGQNLKTVKRRHILRTSPEFRSSFSVSLIHKSYHPKPSWTRHCSKGYVISSIHHHGNPGRQLFPLCRWENSYRGFAQLVGGGLRGNLARFWRAGIEPRSLAPEGVLCPLWVLAASPFLWQVLRSMMGSASQLLNTSWVFLFPNKGVPILTIIGIVSYMKK